MYWICSTIFLISQITLILCALPPVDKCKLSDSECIKSSGQKLLPLLTGDIPELKTPVLDMMHVDEIDVDLAGLKLTMTDNEIKGLKGTIIDSLSVDMVKQQINLVFHTDVSLEGKYVASGKLLILPISGDGDVEIKLKNIEVSVVYSFDIIKGKNGKDVINLKSQKYTYDVKGNAEFYLGNLFNGNKELSDTMLKFMNENWKLLSQEFGAPVLKKPMKNVYNTIKAYFIAQPLEDIAHL